MSPLKAHYFCSLLIGLRGQTDKNDEKIVKLKQKGVTVILVLIWFFRRCLRILWNKLFFEDNNQVKVKFKHNGYEQWHRVRFSFKKQSITAFLHLLRLNITEQKGHMKLQHRGDIQVPLKINPAFIEFHSQCFRFIFLFPSCLNFKLQKQFQVYQRDILVVSAFYFYYC